MATAHLSHLWITCWSWSFIKFFEKFYLHCVHVFLKKSFFLRNEMYSSECVAPQRTGDLFRVPPLHPTVTGLDPETQWSQKGFSQFWRCIDGKRYDSFDEYALFYHAWFIFQLVKVEVHVCLNAFILECMQIYFKLAKFSFAFFLFPIPIN